MDLSTLLMAEASGLRLTTGFEDWCEQRRVHPETLGAWEAYEDDCLRALTG